MGSITCLDLDRLREEKGASYVDQGSAVPRWLSKEMRAAVKAQGLKPKHHPYCLFQQFLAHCKTTSKYVDRFGDDFEAAPCSYFLLFDHQGTTTIDGQKCFVLEPYKSGSSQAEYEKQLDLSVGKFSRLLGCSVTWSRKSWHYPDFTYRILFEPR
jgi:hypothetical protein